MTDPWTKTILWFIALGIALVVAMLVLVHPAHAEVFVFGSNQNYSVAMLPNNSYVHQGENITQGYCYDLTGVYGFSGELAYWNKSRDPGIDDPDIIITLSHPRTVCIDPAAFPEGKYYQWDEKSCTLEGICTTGFGHGNAYVLAVAALPVSLQQKTVVYTSNIKISQNGTEIEIPVTYTIVQTFYGTPTPTPTVTTTYSTSGTIEVPTTEPTEDTSSSIMVADAQDRNGVPINGGVSEAVPVTRKSPGPCWIIVAAIIGSVIMYRRNKP